MARCFSRCSVLYLPVNNPDLCYKTHQRLTTSAVAGGAVLELPPVSVLRRSGPDEDCVETTTALTKGGVECDH